MVNFSNKETLKEVLQEAREKRYAIGQFNFSSLEQLQGILMAAKETNMPLICGTSSGEADFFGMEEAVSCVHVMRRKFNVPVFLNLDHGKDVNKIKKAIDLGYDMVHFDGSKMLPEESIEKAREVVLHAKNKNVLVEGEIAEIKGSSTINNKEVEQIELMEIDRVADFIKKTEVDLFALDIGSVHGVYKNAPEIHFERVSQMLDIVSCFMVLHGGSGIKDEDIKSAVNSGIVKININTDLRIAWRSALEKNFQENPEEVVPYKILPSARDAVYEKVIEKITLFKS